MPFGFKKKFLGVVRFSRVWAPWRGGVGPYEEQPGATGVSTASSGVSTSLIHRARTEIFNTVKYNAGPYFDSRFGFYTSIAAGS